VQSADGSSDGNGHESQRTSTHTELLSTCILTSEVAASSPLDHQFVAQRLQGRQSGEREPSRLGEVQRLRHLRHAAASAKIRRAARRRGVGYRYLFMHPSGADLEVLAGLVDKGILKTVTDRVFPFEQIADAFAYLEQGHAKGKVVVQMS